MKNKKFILLPLLSIVLSVLLSAIIPNHSFASEPVVSRSSEVKDGYVIITTITRHSTLSLQANKGTPKTSTFSKTTECKDASHHTLWSLKLTATFTYDGSSSKCTSCSENATSSSSAWSISSSSSRYSGNSANATASANKTNSHGKIISTQSLNVSLTCDANGNAS